MSAGVTESPEMHDRRDEPVTAADLQRRRRGRSVAIAIILAALVVLFYLVTVVKLGPGVMSRPL
ncbi:hypothetical protein [Bauldia sp.]|uniref:hypothetical protein n=1 Tax=Bauldia sp. TaxID=2575872 RepID=UPI003BA975B2